MFGDGLRTLLRRTAGRDARMKHHPSRTGLTRDTQHGPVWTGEVRFNEEWLMQPFKWARPRRIDLSPRTGICSTNPNVFYKWLDRIWAVMALNSRHTFLCAHDQAAERDEGLSGISSASPWTTWEDRAREDGHCTPSSGRYWISTR